MKKTIFLTLILFFLAGLAYGKDYELTKKVDELTVVIKIDKNPPVVGENNLIITLKDASGRKITNATVKAEYSMPPMPGMPAMNYKTDAELKGTDYKARINPSMAGGWNFTIFITQASTIRKVKFNVDVK